MRWAVLATVLAGCGRIAFDGGGDASTTDGGACVPVGHDEDGDSIDDACDLCPQRVDNGVDTDGDTVGDSCDVSPLRQTRVLFDPFTSERNEWDMVLGTYTGDAVRFDTPDGGSGASLAAAPGFETFEIHGDLLLGGTATAQIAISIGDIAPAPAHYYCEIYDDGTSVALLLTYTLDGTAFTNLAMTPLTGRFDSGPFRIIFQHGPTTSSCWAEWKGGTANVSGTNPVDVPSNQVGVALFQVRADLRSFVRLADP